MKGWALADEEEEVKIKKDVCRRFGLIDSEGDDADDVEGEVMPLAERIASAGKVCARVESRNVLGRIVDEVPLAARSQGSCTSSAAHELPGIPTIVAN